MVVVGLLTLASIGGTASIARFGPDGDPHMKAEVVVTMTDKAVEESSGLVFRGNRFYTINDSGDGPNVYAVDATTGDVDAVTRYDDEDPVDVEAIAPGAGRSLWVGDIGDNQRARGSVRLYHLVPPPGGGVVESEKYDLQYPDGPHDAEALLVHPRTGRVLVVTKRPIIGGVVYRAPRDLEPGRMHRLEEVASVPGFITDGAFFPDGRHLVLRTYGTAAVYTYPGFEQVGSAFDLPAQEQGEGIAVGADGRLYLSTEEVPSDILAIDLPAKVAAAMRADADTAGADQSDAGSAQGDTGAARGGTGSAQDDSGPAPDRDGARGDGAVEQDRPGLGRPPGYALALVVGTVLAGLAVRASRRRGRRRP